MRAKTFQKKLSLNKKTVAVLDTNQMDDIQAGYFPITYTLFCYTAFPQGEDLCYSWGYTCNPAAY